MPFRAFSKGTVTSDSTIFLQSELAALSSGVIILTPATEIPADIASTTTLTGSHNAITANTGVYMLLDTSGTYAEELEKAEQIIRYTLSRLGETDTFAVARIDTGSFSEKDIIAKVTFDDRPSIANNQKRAFQKKINDFVGTVKGSSYTDISGGILQAAIGCFPHCFIQQFQCFAEVLSIAARAV